MTEVGEGVRGKVRKTQTTMLNIRRYEMGDHETVLKLHEAELRAVGAFLGHGVMDDDLDDVRAAYLESGGEFLVGESDGRVVAMGALKRTSPESAELKRMRVESGLQRRGYGRALLSVLERRAAELGYRKLHLDTALVQHAARSLYEANGYREARRGKVGHLDCVFYEKNLA